MYFNTETQTRVLQRFHFALKDNRYIFLGKRQNVVYPLEPLCACGTAATHFTKVSQAMGRDPLLARQVTPEATNS